MKNFQLLQSLFWGSLAIVAVTAQTSCSASNAFFITNQAGGSSSIDTSGCNGDPGCLATLGQASGYLSAGTLSGIGSLSARSLPRRQTAQLSCTAAEQCFSYNNVLFCVDLNTGSFHDITGGQGNFVTGAYTAGNSQAATVTGTRPVTAATTASTPSTVTVTSQSSPQSSSAGMKMDSKKTLQAICMLGVWEIWALFA